MIELPSRYNPQEIEDKWYKEWEENKLFAAKPDPNKKPYTIVIPPPNVTGILHMGHALNNTIQDVLTRWQRMCGRNVVWVPGTDHAAVATQAKVEKILIEGGMRNPRQELGREKLLEKIREYAGISKATILKQIKNNI
jgi:valyl-tRNA synthetase